MGNPYDNPERSSLTHQAPKIKKAPRVNLNKESSKHPDRIALIQSWWSGISAYEIKNKLKVMEDMVPRDSMFSDLMWNLILTLDHKRAIKQETFELRHIPKGRYDALWTKEDRLDEKIVELLSLVMNRLLQIEEKISVNTTQEYESNQPVIYHNE